MLKMADCERRIADTAEEIWAMEQNHEYHEDVWAHYMSMIYFGDYWDYKNCFGYHPPLISRHAMARMAMEIPSLAYIDPHKTKELGFYLHVAVKNLQNKNLQDTYNQYDSQGMLKAQQGLAAAFYKMVSGKNLHDEDFHKTVRQLYETVIETRNSMQRTAGLQTIMGQFQPLTNFMTMMALKLHDQFFHTSYSHICEEMMSFIRENLIDKETGLFYDERHTGALGFPGEILTPSEAWVRRDVKASNNGYAIAYLNFFDPQGAEKAWQSWREIFADRLLSCSAAQLLDSRTSSYLTGLPAEAEAYYGGMLAAREMEDKDCFEKLLKHLNEIARPRLSEGKIWFDALGECQDLHGLYILEAKSHVPWKRLFEHDWSRYFQYDCNKVR